MLGKYLFEFGRSFESQAFVCRYECWFTCSWISPWAGRSFDESKCAKAGDAYRFAINSFLYGAKRRVERVRGFLQGGAGAHLTTDDLDEL